MFLFNESPAEMKRLRTTFMASDQPGVDDIRNALALASMATKLPPPTPKPRVVTPAPYYADQLRGRFNRAGYVEGILSAKEQEERKSVDGKTKRRVQRYLRAENEFVILDGKKDAMKLELDPRQERRLDYLLGSLRRRGRETIPQKAFLTELFEAKENWRAATEVGTTSEADLEHSYQRAYVIKGDKIQQKTLQFKARLLAELAKYHENLRKKSSSQQKRDLARMRHESKREIRKQRKAALLAQLMKDIRLMDSQPRCLMEDEHWLEKDIDTLENDTDSSAEEEEIEELEQEEEHSSEMIVIPKAEHNRLTMTELIMKEINRESPKRQGADRKTRSSPFMGFSSPPPELVPLKRRGRKMESENEEDYGSFLLGIPKPASLSPRSRSSLAKKYSPKLLEATSVLPSLDYRAELPPSVPFALRKYALPRHQGLKTFNERPLQGKALQFVYRPRYVKPSLEGSRSESVLSTAEEIKKLRALVKTPKSKAKPDEHSFTPTSKVSPLRLSIGTDGENNSSIPLKTSSRPLQRQARLQDVEEMLTTARKERDAEEKQDTGRTLLLTTDGVSNLVPKETKAAPWAWRPVVPLRDKQRDQIYKHCTERLERLSGDDKLPEADMLRVAAVLKEHFDKIILIFSFYCCLGAMQSNIGLLKQILMKYFDVLEPPSGRMSLKQLKQLFQSCGVIDEKIVSSEAYQVFEDNILREIRADPLALAAATTKALDGSTTFQITLPEFCLCLVRIGVIRFQGQTRCGLRPITLQLLPSSCLALFLVDCMLPWVTGLEADVLPRESFNSDEFKEIFSKHAYVLWKVCCHYSQLGTGQMKKGPEALRVGKTNPSALPLPELLNNPASSSVRGSAHLAAGQVLTPLVSTTSFLKLFKDYNLLSSTLTKDQITLAFVSSRNQNNIDQWYLSYPSFIEAISRCAVFKYKMINREEEQAAMELLQPKTSRTTRRTNRTSRMNTIRSNRTERSEKGSLLSAKTSSNSRKENQAKNQSSLTLPPEAKSQKPVTELDTSSQDTSVLQLRRAEECLDLFCAFVKAKRKHQGQMDARKNRSQKKSTPGSSYRVSYRVSS